MCQFICRSDGDIEAVLAAAVLLPLQMDSAVAAAAAALLLCFSKAATDQPVLAKPEAMALLLQLLQVHHYRDQ